jgi:hypothetical protein
MKNPIAEEVDNRLANEAVAIIFMKDLRAGKLAGDDEYPWNATEYTATLREVILDHIRALRQTVAMAQEELDYLFT